MTITAVDTHDNTFLLPEQLIDVVPTVPSGLATNVISSTEIDLSWSDTTTDATGFDIEWSANGAEFQMLDTTSVGAISYHATDLTPGTNYSFRVKTVSNGGSSDPSSPATAQTNPPAPTGLSATVNTDGSVNLAWNDVAGRTGFEVDRSSNSGSWSSIGTTSGATTLTDSPGTSQTYSYRVMAMGPSNDSAFSASIAVSFLPATPINVSATSPYAYSYTGQVYVQWQNGTGAAPAHFEIQRSTDGMIFTTIATVLPATYATNYTNYYTDQSISNPGLYWYRIKALNSSGSSPFSAIVKYDTAFNSLSFADLSEGTVVSNQEPDVSFSSNDPTQPSIFTFQNSPTHFVHINTASAATYLDITFTEPVNHLTFYYSSSAYDPGWTIYQADGSVTTPVIGGSVSSNVAAMWGYNLSNIIKIRFTFPKPTNLYLRDFKFVEHPTLIQPHRAGDNFGTAVSDTVKNSGDPSKYVVLVDDDYQIHTDFSTPDNGGSTVNTTGTDTDLAKITLKQLPSYLTTGTISINLSTPGNVRLFKSDGTLLSSSDLTLDLANPTGYLAGITSGDINVYVQAMHNDPDFIFKLSCKDPTGNEVARDTVHMLLADWQFVNKNDDPVNGLANVSEEQLADLSSGDPNAAPLVDDNNIDELFRIRIDGLPSQDVQQIKVVSDVDSNDYYIDSFGSDPNKTESADFASMYFMGDGESEIGSAERASLQGTLQINVVDDPTPAATAATTQDSFTRQLPLSPTQVLLRALQDEFHALDGTAFFRPTGLAALLSQLESLATSGFFTVQFATAAQLGSADATYTPGDHIMRIKPTLDGTTAVNEMIRVLDDKNGWYPGNSDPAYYASSALEWGLADLITASKLLKKIDNIKPGPSAAALAVVDWNSAWSLQGFLGIYGQIISLPGNGASRNLTPADLWDVNAKLGVRFSCGFLRPIYEQLLANKGIIIRDGLPASGIPAGDPLE